MSTSPSFSSLLSYFKNLQNQIVDALEDVDAVKFLRDPWEKSGTLAGYGTTCILENGSVFERAGVAFSCIQGQSLPASASSHRAHLIGLPFQAMGVSLVLHPKNPHVPTVHMNVRAFSVTRTSDNNLPESIDYWLGGGMDLTPYYPWVEDCQHFHQTCKNALDGFGIGYYSQFKNACDDYFYLKHRQEARGIGGIFFDDFNALGASSPELLKSVGDAFIPAYLPIVKKRQAMDYTDAQRTFQAMRRGRYVEFNLIYDRGTLFGLQSGGRTESILMSMPPNCAWTYQYQAPTDTPESLLLKDFLLPRDWV